MGSRIFVVDDDPVIRELMLAYLTAHGHSVEALDSGGACLLKLESEIPEILILDMIMPDMNGAQVLEKIRATDRTTTIPVILLSADTATASKASPSDQQANRYIQKPFKIQEILAAVSELKTSQG